MFIQCSGDNTEMRGPSATFSGVIDRVRECTKNAESLERSPGIYGMQVPVSLSGRGQRS